MPFATAETAVASVGATTAPSTHATGQDRPSQWPTTATAPAVTSTRTTEVRTTTRRLVRISRSDVVSDSQYSSAGRNSSSTTSGGSVTSAVHGTQASGTPPSSSTTGPGARSLRASQLSTSTAVKITTSTCRTCAFCTGHPSRPFR